MARNHVYPEEHRMNIINRILQYQRFDCSRCKGWEKGRCLASLKAFMCIFYREKKCST